MTAPRPRSEARPGKEFPGSQRQQLTVAVCPVDRLAVPLSEFGLTLTLVTVAVRPLSSVMTSPT